MKLLTLSFKSQFSIICEIAFIQSALLCRFRVGTVVHIINSSLTTYIWYYCNAQYYYLCINIDTIYGLLCMFISSTAQVWSEHYSPVDHLLQRKADSLACLCHVSAQRQTRGRYFKEICFTTNLIHPSAVCFPKLYMSYCKRLFKIIYVFLTLGFSQVVVIRETNTRSCRTFNLCHNNFRE